MKLNLQASVFNPTGTCNNLAAPLLQEKQSIKDFLTQVYPLPIGDLMQDPLVVAPWWRYQMMYFHHLLQLHPDHPNTLDPAGMDPWILTGTIAWFTLIIHNIVLEMRKPLQEEMQKGITKDIADLLPLLPALTSLNFLTCIYTVFMLVMGNVLTTSVWDHLFNILLLILLIMKAHTVSESGTEHHPMTDSPSAITAYSSILIPFKVLQLIWRYKGQLWRLNYRIIIQVPCKTWTHYGTNQMTVEQEHNFKQLAWIQMSQFYANNLLNTINQITPYEDLPRTRQELQSYVKSNLHKKHFIKLFYKTNTYLTDWTGQR